MISHTSNSSLSGTFGFDANPSSFEKLAKQTDTYFL